MPKRERETGEMIAMARRIIRAVGARVADADEFELHEFAQLQHDLEQAMTVAVAGQLTRGSWQTIGDALEISRVAAFKRYAEKIRQL
ncbi:MAG: hypothetical protein K0S37_3659 [Microbacterium sp.]|jgi:hypothetical protein|nr:hypothetical protein [Microbacterium sp.]